MVSMDALPNLTSKSKPVLSLIYLCHYFLFYLGMYRMYKMKQRKEREGNQEGRERSMRARASLRYGAGVGGVVYGHKRCWGQNYRIWSSDL